MKPILFAALLIAAACPNALAQNDTSLFRIDSAVVTAYRNTAPLRVNRTGIMDIDMELMSAMPKILGNTDPLNVIKFMPGVQTVSEYDAGINIQGCDDHQSLIALNGVPIYGAKHLFGIFSVFNPGHFGNFRFERNPVSGSAGNRLGGLVDMQAREMKDRTAEGEISAGIMSAQGSVCVRPCPGLQLNLSGRQTFMNQLYRRFLKFGGSPLQYGFGDFNFSLIAKPGDKDRILLDAYYGADDLDIRKAMNNLFNIRLQWGNYAAGLHWDHRFRNSSLRQSLSMSTYGSRASIAMTAEELKMPAFIRSFAYKGLWKGHGFQAGAEVIYHHVLPQRPTIETRATYSNDGEGYQNGVEADLFADYSKEFLSGFGFSAGLKGILYFSPDKKTTFHGSPAASMWWNLYRYGKITVSYALQHQFLFRGGISNIGLPIDFWFMAGKYSAPQMAHSTSLSYNAGLFGGRWSADLGVYYKRLYHQVEYEGTMLDFFRSVYDLNDYLLKGEGENYGVNVMVSKNTGKLTGWVSWSWGRAQRRFTNHGYRKTYPANHERIHELNAALAYRTGRWNLSGTLVYATGLPFTPPAYFYITAGQIVTIYGEHNSGRMKPYFRLDISADYSFIRNEKNEFGANLSCYNVLGNRNDAMYRLNVKDDSFSIEPEYFRMRFVPSVSLFYKF